MRAGNLDRIITIERVTTTVDDYGTPVEGWATVATLRAELIQSSAQEFIRAYGATTDTIAIFRTRFLDGVTTADRVTYASRAYDLKEIKEIGRREGLELRCIASGGT
jgi:SPP1 family predicted phage head-tail adaptor